MYKNKMNEKKEKANELRPKTELNKVPSNRYFQSDFTPAENDLLLSESED